MRESDYSAAIEHGIGLRAGGDHKAALAAFGDLAARRPEKVEAYIESGQTEAAAQRLDAALEWFQRAETVAPSNFWPYYLQVDVLRGMSRHEQALRAAEAGSARCRGKVSGLEYDHLVKAAVDLKALCLEAEGGAKAPPAARPPDAGKPIPGALHVSVVKDAEDIIFASLGASYRAGIRHFAVADNGSLDATRSEIERFRAAHADSVVFLATDPIVGHYQAAKTMGLVRLACTILEATGISLDWIFPIDADELLYVAPEAGDLADLLAGTLAKAAKLLVYYHYNAASSEIYETLPAGADVVNLFPNYAGLARVPVRKAAFRNLGNAYVEEGGHFCSGLVTSLDDVVNGAELGVSLRHFPIRSMSQLRSKIVNGGRSIAALANTDIGAHWRTDFDNYGKLGDAYLRQRIQGYNAAGRV